MANLPINPQVFGMWEETGAPGGNPRRRRENLQTPHRQYPEPNPGRWSCEAAVLTTVPPAVVQVDGTPIRLQLCDTAGQDEFDKLRHFCYHKTDVFLLCFSVVSPSSFQNIAEKWMPEIRHHCPTAPVVLVGTQCDLREDVKVLIELAKCKEKPVPQGAARVLAEKIDAVAYVECSSLTQKNLKEVFDMAILCGLRYADSRASSECKMKMLTANKMRTLSKSWWKKYVCIV
ncbi:ras homolog family member Ub isoform X2 [Heterodontus francisci]|uniref:ras homolog family member Ub isoform X2 n=1 Tax=Heterodontus francisci TaxID=7792 RepID=UPI00355B799A